MIRALLLVCALVLLSVPVVAADPGPGGPPEEPCNPNCTGNPAMDALAGDLLAFVDGPGTPCRPSC